MEIGDWRELNVECDSGSLKINAWAKDCADNAPFISFQTDSDSGHASFTLDQAKRLSTDLAALVFDLEQASMAVKPSR